MMDTIRVLIADDHPVVREGLRGLIATEPGMAVIGEAADGIEAVEKTRALRPDVILLDIMMPRQDGISAIGEIMRDDPNALILVLTSFAEDQHVFPAVKAGALGYLLKDSSPQELLDAIRHVYRGESSLHPSIARKVLGELKCSSGMASTKESSLTERELEVLQWMAQGLCNRDIASRLTLSERTVRCHVSSILRKLHLNSRTQAALYSVREGLVRS